MIFELAAVRFATSGLLIGGYAIADHFARRGARPEARVPAPGWVRPLIIVSLTAYYLLIGPTGGALAGGAGNLAGVLLCGVAMAVRRPGSVRYPEHAARSLFYVALPIAAGVPWGLLALSLPACAASVWCCRRADAMRLAGRADDPLSSASPRFRMIPGVW